MKTLAELSTELERTTKTAQMNIEDLPVATAGAWGTAIREAKEGLKGLEQAYKTTLFRNAVAIFLDGDSSKAVEFGKLVRDEGEGLCVDANALYDRLTMGVETSIGASRQWGVAQTSKLHLELKEVMEEVGLKEMPMPAKDAMPFVKTPAETLAHVKEILHAAVGNDLNRMYLDAQVVKQAREIRYTGTMVPVLIMNAATDETQDLGRSYAKGSAFVTMTADDKIDKDYLMKTFKDVNKKIRKK